ncbi:hypothetical protein [Chryseobacterium sp. Leaf394]|uniref:hypothetical protein n=1 Tax=Chryseobacterium sp. Leaf394 TaxID=1736361 RepID=UPI0007021B5F|nr:hypothetical protein [Chryseobacterium sp. Leaf394]KQS93966.1 hypothetical protein ASG21_19360 [Chryseobacterium sp. Leaf394]
MTNFNPNINRSIFKNEILEIQQNEGNNSTVVNIIEKELTNSKELYFFEQFLNICRKYNINYVSTVNENLLEITIKTNGYESLKISYKNKDKDISIELAKILYGQLSIQILNKIFFDNMKNKR